LRKYKIFIAALFFVAAIISCQKKSVRLKWHQKGNYRWANVALGYFGDTGFEKLDPSETNVSFEVSATHGEIKKNQMLLRGSGVATADVDGDGLVDVYFGQLHGSNKLFKNTGNFHFKDITDQAGVAHTGNYTTAVLFADVDGDGDPDLIVNTLEGKIGLYINDGSGHFSTEKKSGLGEGDGGSTLTMADIDGDGDLDLFIANDKKQRVFDMFSQQEMSDIVQRNKGGGKRYTFKKPFGQYFDILHLQKQPDKLREIGTKNKLFINDGSGHFKDVTDEPGRFVDQNEDPYNRPADWSLTALFRDINGDGLPDLYVCNDYFYPDRVWINQGKGYFKEIDGKKIRRYSYSSMGVDVSDINRDGYPDIFTTEMLSQHHSKRARQQRSQEHRIAKISKIDYQPQYMQNNLFLNRGDYTYAEIAYYSGVQASEWSWATRFLDVDLDGYEDIIINTGFAYDSIDMDYYSSRGNKRAIDLDKTPNLNDKNKIFRNNHDLTFTDKSEDWGFDKKDVSYGLATADLDNDGDLDLVTSRFKFGAAIYKNTTNAPRIGVRLKGKKDNSQIIGAKVILKGGPVKQTKTIVSGGDYLSSSDAEIAFAANADNQDHKITVKWPNGSQTNIDSVSANRIYEISEPGAAGGNQIARSSHQDTARTLFNDVSNRIGYQHHDDFYKDWNVQQLLPIRLSRLGPGVSWIDYDQDGDDDLFISAGRNGRLGAFENEGNGQFKRLKLDGLISRTNADQTTILGWPNGNKTRLIVGNANYETGSAKAPSALVYSINRGKVANSGNVSGIFSTTGPLAAADYDGDGDIDLFVGGRFVPTQYPKNATSRLFKNENGKFILDKTNSRKLKNIGLVTGAVFTDFDNDGDSDLLISRAWDSLLLLKNDNGNFHDVSAKYGFDTLKGWWNGVATGDFNNDGKMDIVATNWGLNTPYKFNPGFPLKMYYQDFNRDGRINIIEAYYDPAMGGYVPRRQMKAFKPLSNVMLSGVSNNKDYANSTLKQLLSPAISRIPSREINIMSSMLFINKGDHFEKHPLPKEAQFSPAFDAAVADYDNDGNEDLFLSQNFFGMPPYMPRLDAGRGLLLEGDGTGHFKSIPGQKSGIKIYGEQRGAALSDFNDDGKVDLAVSQNDTTTKLYMNQISRRGISIQLKNPEKNDTVIGAKLWLEYDDSTRGPVREIDAGSGYWSQNSFVQILGIKQRRTPVNIIIKWADNTKQKEKIKRGKWTYQILKKGQ